MSKMSNVLAALGVVAALGVAALPLSTYAQGMTTEWAETGGSATTYGTTDNANWVKAQTTVELTVKDLLIIETDASTVEMTSTDNENFTSNATPLSITMTSKNPKGATMTIAGSTSGTYEQGDEEKDKVATSLYNGFYEIPTGAFTVADDLADENTSVWGWQLYSESAAPTAYKAVPTAANAAENGSVYAAPTAGKYTEKVVFGAKIGAGQAAGKYSGEVTFTVTNTAA